MSMSKEYYYYVYGSGDRDWFDTHCVSQGNGTSLKIHDMSIGTVFPVYSDNKAFIVLTHEGLVFIPSNPPESRVMTFDEALPAYSWKTAQCSKYGILKP